MIVGGITTDVSTSRPTPYIVDRPCLSVQVCTAFLALSLIEEGYEVFANADASGAFNKAIADNANDRMRHAGVQVLSFWAIIGELTRDWTSTPGAVEVFPFLDK